MTLKYVVCPGEVKSISDGQRHYVGPMTLMHLYRVDPRECDIYEPEPWWTESQFRLAKERHRELSLVPLCPRDDGNYSLPVTHD